MKIPRLWHKRSSEQGAAKIAGKVYYFGRWPRDQKTPPPKVQSAYDEFIGRWIRRRLNAAPSAPITSDQPLIAELWAAFLEHAKAYYRKDGKETTEVSCFLSVGRILDEKFGEMCVDEFRPNHLEQLQFAMIEKGWARTSINKQVGRVRQIFKWSNKKSIVPDMTLFALKSVDPLKRGRTEAVESVPIKPVALETVLEGVKDMRDPFPDMCHVHWLLGCRSQDIVRMTPAEIFIDETGWRYEPAGHKTEHHGRELVYFIGPRAKEILQRRMADTKPDEPIFPSFRRRGGQKSPYSTHSYNKAIQRHLEEKKRPAWIPLQIKHDRLTLIRAKYDAESARTIAGHSHVRTTEIYAERDHARARKIMDEIG